MKYESKILGYKKVTKGDHVKLRVESEIKLESGFIMHPNFELSATETKKFLAKNLKKNVKPNLKKLFEAWIEENIEHLIELNLPRTHKIKVMEEKL